MTEPMTAASAPKESRATDKRQAILQAALELFVELGFHGTAVPQIAKQAGVGAGTIYRYFESKEALVNALYREWKQKLVAHLVPHFDPTGDPKTQFTLLWRRMADFVLAHPIEYTFIELHHHAAYMDAASLQLEDQSCKMVTVLIAAAQARGDYRLGKPEVLWALVEGAFMGLARNAREGRLELTPDIVDSAGEAAWELVRPK